MFFLGPKGGGWAEGMLSLQRQIWAARLREAGVRKPAQLQRSCPRELNNASAEMVKGAQTALDAGEGGGRRRKAHH